MSAKTRQEVLAKKRWRYGRAGKEHKGKILDEVVELFGYHRKAAIRALRPKATAAAPYVPGRPREYDPEKLLPPLKAIWLAAPASPLAARPGKLGRRGSTRSSPSARPRAWPGA